MCPSLATIVFCIISWLGNDYVNTQKISNVWKYFFSPVVAVFVKLKTVDTSTSYD
jgi:hypothetical protein